MHEGLSALVCMCDGREGFMIVESDSFAPLARYSLIGSIPGISVPISSVGAEKVSSYMHPSSIPAAPR